MPRLPLLAACLGLSLLAPGVALADPWQDESGHGRGAPAGSGRDHDRHDRQWREAWRERGDGHRSERAPAQPWHAAPPIPPGHLPPPGEARAWYPGLPPGHQPPPFGR
ncbi:hypothetical protein [Siccirubricoccus phaeus]|uniref:hypothetical protein n=1 Tax=Siccirubricoccus phaeus TaxID=2595053 RepID=UPI0011F3EC0F|nr:hypothetical protein [Siccirubricoccus phaeus]